MKKTVLAAALFLATAGCASAGGSTTAPVVFRLGYFPNITHATAIVGVRTGIFERALAPARLRTQTFSAGPAVVEALFSGSIDASYVGPGPAINAFVKSHGEAVRVVAGATSGGASFVVAPSIRSADDLRGKTVASPQLGNTQDVALRSWLASKGLRTDLTGSGDVRITPQDNAQTLESFRAGRIAGAWVPEPWATRLRVQGGGKVLVDERDLWPGGRYATTLLVVRAAFLRRHPDVVERLVHGQVEADAYVNAHPEDSRRIVREGIAAVTGKALPAAVVAEAWKNLTFTDDPIVSSIDADAAAAKRLGFLKQARVAGLVDLSIVNRVLTSAGKAAIAAS